MKSTLILISNHSFKLSELMGKRCHRRKFMRLTPYCIQIKQIRITAKSAISLWKIRENKQTFSKSGWADRTQRASAAAGPVPGLHHPPFRRSRRNSQVQGDQINMTVLFLYLVKSDASERYCTHVNTRYQKNTAMLNWSPSLDMWIRTFWIRIQR